MSQYRRGRVNETLVKEISDIIRDIKDPRVSGAFISVTGVECTPDLKYAKIFYSVLGDFDEKELNAGLKSAVGYVRGQIAQRVNLRITPEIKFIRDDTMKKADEINRLLKTVETELAEADKRDAEASEKADNTEKTDNSDNTDNDNK